MSFSSFSLPKFHLPLKSDAEKVELKVRQMGDKSEEVAKRGEETVEGREDRTSTTAVVERSVGRMETG